MKIKKEKLEKSIGIFDGFMSDAIDDIDPEEVNITELMIAYNYIKNALSTIQFDED